MREHGYESHRLVIELLNDDMPFLVDSLSGELARIGFTLARSIHSDLAQCRPRPARDVAGRNPAGAAGPQGGEDWNRCIHFEPVTTTGGAFSGCTTTRKLGARAGLYPRRRGVIGRPC